MSDDSSCSGSPSTQPSLSEYDNSSCDEDEYETNYEPEVESGRKYGSQNLPRNNEREIYDDDDTDKDSDNDYEVYVSQLFDLDLDPKRTDLSDHDSDDDWATQEYDQASTESSHNSNTESENTDLNESEWSRCEECAATKVML